MDINKVFSALLTATVIFSGCVSKKESKTGESTGSMSITKEKFGTIDNKTIGLFTLQNSNGMKVSITNYGGIITSLMVPDKEGNLTDVVLGFDSLQPYLDGHPYFGAIVGRYGNRIAHGEFSLDGTKYTLAINNGNNHLHGGIKGFDKVIWSAEPLEEENRVGLTLHYLSPDGEEGYPGNLDNTVTYWLNNANELEIDYESVTDKPTHVNLTSHSYFNLKGAGNGGILGHYMQIDAGRYTVVNDELIPTGELRAVDGTPFDFRKPKLIGKDIEVTGGGYDHNFVLDNNGNFTRVIETWEPESGIVMEVLTDQPGVQFYTGNFLDGSITGKGNLAYHKNYGFCLETQHFPDSPNQPDFPSTILRPGEKHLSKTIYRYSNKGND